LHPDKRIVAKGTAWYQKILLI